MKWERGMIDQFRKDGVIDYLKKIDAKWCKDVNKKTMMNGIRKKKESEYERLNKENIEKN